jgi:hypothetical protein
MVITRELNHNVPKKHQGVKGEIRSVMKDQCERWFTLLFPTPCGDSCQVRYLMLKGVIDYSPNGRKPRDNTIFND